MGRFPSVSRLEEDPFDLNGSNPNRNWTVVLSPRALQNRLGAARKPADAIVTSRKSGRVDRVRLERGSWAQTFPLSGLGPEWFRSALGLRSSRFDLGVLAATPVKRETVCSARLRVNLLAREATGVTLQRRRSGSSSWTDMSLQQGADAAHFYGIDRPCRATSYRLHSSAASSGPVAVKVTPKIVFSATQPANDGLEGSVRPISLAGQTMHLDRKRNDGTWNKNVGSAVVQSDGKWHAHFNAVSGPTARASRRRPRPGSSPARRASSTSTESQARSSSSGTSRILRAGFPTTTARAGTSRRTTRRRRRRPPRRSPPPEAGLRHLRSAHRAG